jgi:chorismate mutase/prephenate dehydratase
MLMEAELKIVAQIYLEIAHCLISLSQLNEIKSVHSKDNALGQCREWLARMLPGVELVECASTAQAVKSAKDNSGAAAIASRLAADMYGVPVVCENIRDRDENITRFLVIGKTTSGRVGNGRDKTSLVFTLHDKPGALLRALQCFSFRGINLCKIESRPSRQRVWDYFFYVDIIGHVDDENVKEAVAELKTLCPIVRWLGSYPNAGL